MQSISCSVSKSLHLKHVFVSYFVFARGSNFLLWSHIFSHYVAACTIFDFMSYSLLNNARLERINSTSVFCKYAESSNVFPQSLKILRMPFMNKNIPAERDEMFLWKKKVSPKWDPVFLKDGFMLGRMIYFHINRFWYFNRVLLSGEISPNRGPHFSGMFFLHINTP